MSDFGHVKISRKAYKLDPYWNEPRQFSRWEAWEWMIQAAAWRSYSKVTKRAGVLQIERGETPPLAERFLADHWGWASKNRARRFLDELEGLGRIRTGQRTAEGTTYHLVNYELYQSNGPETDRTTDQTRTSDGPHADQNRSSKAVKAPPTTPPSAREAETEQPDDATAARNAMWEVFRSRSQDVDAAPRKAEALVRGIIDGDTATAWQTPTGDPVPWNDRPRLFRLALDELAASGGKLHNVLRLVVIPREFDPFVQTKSGDRKPKSGNGNGATPPITTQPPDHAAERRKLEQENPREFAEALTEFERYAWWAAEPEPEKVRHLRLAIREKAPKVAIVR